MGLGRYKWLLQDISSRTNNLQVEDNIHSEFLKHTGKKPKEILALFNKI
jgi:hypothetical protein